MAEMRKIANFELLERIGQGAMGTVFKARQISMDRIVALKILPPSMAKHKKFIERFVREARASARLNHPNVVNGIDVGHDNGLYYFAMEYIEGENLKDAIKKGRISEQRVIEISRGIAKALTHAHTHGILHRDIKPDNILIDKHQTPKLCDLGLARLDDDKEGEKQLTMQGQAVGTPHYISPEQARGDADIDAKTDLYSLGATMYHLLTGATPFDGPTSVVVMTKHLTEKSPNPNDRGVQLSKGMVAILAKLLAKDRGDRYESAQKLEEDLERLTQGKPPAHTDLPANKWPFLGGAPLSAAVRKAAAVVHSDKPRERERERDRDRDRDRERGTRPREGRGTKNKFAGQLVLAVVIAVIAVIYFGRAKTQSHSDSATADTVSQNPNPPPVDINKQPKPPVVEYKPPSTVRVAPNPEPVGFKKVPDPTPRVAPVNQPIGFKPPPVVQTTPKPNGSESNSSSSSEEKKPPEIKKPEIDSSKTVTVPDIKAPPPEKTAAGPEVSALIAKAVTLADQSKFRDAVALFTIPETKLAAYDEFDREMVKIHAEGYAGMLDLKLKVIEHLKSEPGKIDAGKFIKKNITGPVVGGDEARLQIKGPQVELPYDWHKLSLEELHTLGSLVMPNLPVEISLGFGILAYDHGDDTAAKKYLTGVVHPGGKRALEWIDLRDKALIAKKVAEKNTAAEKVYSEVEAAMVEGNWQVVINKVTELKVLFGDTAKVKSLAADLDNLLDLAKLSAQSGAVIALGNMALGTHGAKIKDAKDGDQIIDGVVTGYTGSEGFGYVTPGDSFTITLAKTCLLRELRILLWDNDSDRYYRFSIEVSADGRDFSQVVDHSRGRWRSWQTIKFSPRPVKAIKVHAAPNSKTNLHVVEVEAYCIPPDKPAQPKFPSEAPNN